MAGSIVTAEAGTPDFDNKWRLLGSVSPYEAILRWMNKDPEKPPVELLLERRPRVRAYMDRDYRYHSVPPVRHNWSEAQLQRRKEFKHRWVVAFSHRDKFATANGRAWDLRKFAAWVSEMPFDVPPELRAMADKQVAKRTDGPRGGKRTHAATSTRGTRKRDRLQDLGRFVDDVCKALNNAGHETREIDGRKQLPKVSAVDLRTIFLARYPGHKSSHHTFAQDLAKIATLRPGPKCYKANDLAEMMAGKISPQLLTK